MRWEDLTAPEFKDAIKLTKGVAIIPVGCLEKHGNQLPLGTDFFIARDLAVAAAEKEPALVVPSHPYGIISEAQHTPGCLSITSQLQYQLLEQLCDELVRNGYNKIILLNGHGGATNFSRYFAQSRLEVYHPYIVYTINAHYRTLKQHEEFAKIYGPLGEMGHADVMETSEIMYTHPEMVHLDRIDVEETKGNERLEFLSENGVFTGIWWYAKYPAHIAGDPTLATAEKGKYLFDLYVNNLANAIKIIKEDDLSLKLQEEFYEKRKKPLK